MISSVAKKFYKKSPNYGEAVLHDGRAVWTNDHLIADTKPPVGYKELIAEFGGNIRPAESILRVESNYPTLLTRVERTDSDVLFFEHVCLHVMPYRKVTPMLFNTLAGYNLLIDKDYVDYIYKNYPTSFMLGGGSCIDAIRVLLDNTVVALVMPLNINAYSRKELEA